MIVGIMTNFNKPTQLAKMTALISKAYGIDIIYLRPKDVDIENNTVKGKFFENNVWVERVTDIPAFIDAVPYCFKKDNRAIMDYLKDKTFLSDNRKNVLSKEQLQEKLKDDANFSHLVIPTHHATDYTDLIDCLDRYSTIVLKPLKGIRGRGVYILEKKSDFYNLGYRTKVEKLNHQELLDFFEESIKSKNYIIQKYVSSRSLQGDPFDCRVHVEKNEEGKWVSARNYIRIGIGQKVISNVNQGGGISDPKPFLKANFGDKYEEIIRKLNNLAVTLPYKIELLRGTHIMSLGMDIGIDRDGELYLFEVNDGPSTAALISEVALLRSNYYKYISNNIIKNSSPKLATSKERQIDDKALLKERNFYKKKNNELLKERNSYKKKYELIRKSTSWRITKPIRFIGSLKKLNTKK